MAEAKKKVVVKKASKTTKAPEVAKEESTDESNVTMLNRPTHNVVVKEEFNNSDKHTWRTVGCAYESTMKTGESMMTLYISPQISLTGRVFLFPRDNNK